MPAARELTDDHGLHSDLALPGRPAQMVRRDIARLSHDLGRATLNIISEMKSGRQATMLCAIILRGGLLLYPGFAAEFSDSDFCLLGMRREHPNKVICEYMTNPGRPAYDVAVLVDCVAATGNTLLTARKVLREAHHITAHVASVISSSKLATTTLVDEGFEVVGFSLNDDLIGNVVTPDLGEMDAGDLFSRLPENPSTGGR